MLTSHNANSNNWKDIQHTSTSWANETLGVSKGPLAIKKETWWWNEEIERAIKSKKEKFKLWQKSKSLVDKELYTVAKKLAKESVAKAKDNAAAEKIKQLST